MSPERTLYVPDMTQGIRGTWWLKAGAYPGGRTPSARGSFHLFPAMNLETSLQNVIQTAALPPVVAPPPMVPNDASSSEDQQDPSAPLLENYDLVNDLERGASTSGDRE